MEEHSTSSSHPDLRQRYVELLKRTLSLTNLSSSPVIPVISLTGKKGFPLHHISRAIEWGLGWLHLQLGYQRHFSVADRENGRAYCGYAHTMIGMKRLDNLQRCIETVVAESVPGDLIETGVWRGGACIFMRGMLEVLQDDSRRVFVADSFEGLPKPDPQHAVDHADKHHTHSFLAIGDAEVRQNFEKYGLLDDRVVFLKGWFKDTLPSAPITALSVLRLDGDLYGSTMDALRVLYPKLSVGGYCIVDDYALQGCKAAIDDYRREHGILDELNEIDWSGRFWRKSRE